VFEAEALFQEYAGFEQIIDPHGAEKDRLQAISRDRLATIQKVRGQVYAG